MSEVDCDTCDEGYHYKCPVWNEHYATCCCGGVTLGEVLDSKAKGKRYQ